MPTGDDMHSDILPINTLKFAMVLVKKLPYEEVKVRASEKSCVLPSME
jgi:hypothetical protein